ncbi:MAG: DM13 domain-containing protein [Bacteroidota bacterium]
MTRSFFSILLLVFVFAATSCSQEEIITIDSSLPNGQLSVQRTGNLVAENSTPTTGVVELGVDDDNENFLRFGTDFTTELATGTVSVYFSTSEVFTADPANGNPDLLQVGSIRGNGEQFFKLDAPVPSNFTHVILWCNTASIPFGNAQLQ